MTPPSKMSEISYFRPIMPIQAAGMKYKAFFMQSGMFTCRRLFCEICEMPRFRYIGGGAESASPCHTLNLRGHVR